jgi:GNAT superfamily N-acetyltransferase
MNDITVRPVLTKKDETTFIKFQWKPYVGDPNFVPPLLMDRRNLIDRKNNPFYKHAAMELFLAERNGEVVGRIAAIVNDNHNKEHNENIGFFGFFECMNNQQVANALFEAAKNWLRGKGVTAIRGPASPSVNDEYGLLIDGFTSPPVILMTYNPPYYATLIENAGFKKAKDLYAYNINAKTAITEKLTRASEIVRKRSGIVTRSLNMKKFDEEVKAIREMYIAAWRRNWGEVPMTEEEFAYVSKDLKAMVEPNLVVIAEVKGKPVGFGLTLPDYNQLLIHNKHGWLLPAVFRILLFRKKINYCRIMILGVVPEYLNTGLGGLLFYETAVRGIARGVVGGEASWVLEDNVRMNKGTEMFQGEIYKTYRLYQMPL